MTGAPAKGWPIPAIPVPRPIPPIPHIGIGGLGGFPEPPPFGGMATMPPSGDIHKLEPEGKVLSQVQARSYVVTNLVSLGREVEADG